MQNAWPEFKYPFKQMLKFMYENPNCNDANKLRRAFMVYDGKEPFKDLYEMDVIDQIVDSEFKDIKLTNKLEDFISFKKPINNISLIRKIYQKKCDGLEILENDLNNFKKRDKYLYEIIYGDQCNIKFSKSNARNFVKNLNEIDKITFLKRLRKAQLKSNIDNEYCDLFNRWMYGIGLANSASKTKIKYLSCRIYLENGDYFIKIPNNNQLCFSFTLQECIENLKKIQDEKYIEIKKTSSLENTPNSAITEYFVNLFFCYKLGIKPSEFKKYVNTQVDNELKPVFTAPGRKSDMWYIKNNRVYCIETTIIKNSKQIRKAETVPCITHLYEIINNKKLDFNNNLLCFINYNKDKNFSESMLKALKTEWSTQLSNGDKKDCELNFKNYSFEDLTKISNL